MTHVMLWGGLLLSLLVPWPRDDVAGREPWGEGAGGGGAHALWRPARPWWVGLLPTVTVGWTAASRQEFWVTVTWTWFPGGVELERAHLAAERADQELGCGQTVAALQRRWRRDRELLHTPWSELSAGQLRRAVEALRAASLLGLGPGARGSWCHPSGSLPR